MRYLKTALLIPALMILSETMAQDRAAKKVWTDAEAQTRVLLKETERARNGNRVFPRTVEKDSVKLVASNDWTSGFWPGVLWMLFEQSGKLEWKQAAADYTERMNREPLNRNSHDVGFKVYDSYGQGFRLTGDPAYKAAILQGAKTLSTRFNATTGVIRSWDFGKWQYPVIIDNMMNLELLFAATRLSGDSSFHRIAVSHARTTMANHFRPDFSSWHVVDYDTLTGKVRGKGTHQGYSDSSAWARGQGWALYGFTLCYRETKDPAFLRQAESIANYLLSHPRWPTDDVPYWDFNVADLSKEPRDASAAAVIASALYELSGFSASGKKYRKAADRILNSLTKKYRAKIGDNHGFLLLHSTGHKPAGGEIDVPLIYADYYFLEALGRSRHKK